MSNFLKFNPILKQFYRFRPQVNLLLCQPCVHLSTAKKSAPLTWKSFGYSVLGFGVIFSAAYMYKTQKTEKLEMSKRKSYGTPAIGGPFDLINTQGKPVNSKDLIGNWILIYFGFTHCPDVCPDELEKMSRVIDKIDKLKKLKHPLVPLFITVDPERDTPQAINDYLKEFSPRILGLTGSKEAIKSVSKRYRVYYSAGPRDKHNDYIVDHTIIMYLIDPDGQFCEYFGQNKTSDEVADIIHMAQVKYLKKKQEEK